MREVFAEQTEFAETFRRHEMSIVDDGNEHFAGAMDFESFLDEESFAVMVMALELDLESAAEDAQGVVIGVEGAIDDRGDHPLGIVMDERLFENAFAGAGFAQNQTEATLLGVDMEDVEDLLLVGQEGNGFRVERMALQAKMGTDHRCLKSFRFEV
jgi:hypothetical protein